MTLRGLGCLFCLLASVSGQAQGLHFSQFFNSPLLVNPANTGLMSDHDFRIGANYRSQWSSVPVPFKSYSFYGDAQLFHKSNRTNWLGLGGAVFSDKSGDGNLSLTRWEAFAAYHIEIGQYQMISVGLSAASVTRSVDFSKLTFDTQWDGYLFNSTLPNGEQGTLAKASYADISTGINYAIFPNEFVYIKLGVGLAHVNAPNESFYSGQANPLGMRQTAYADLLARVGSRVIVNPAIYYTNQKKASELVGGMLVSILMGDDNSSGSLVFGGHVRTGDAVIGSFGYDWNGLRVMASYDFTVSSMGNYNNHNGALELGLRWQGNYPDGQSRERKAYNCPRF
jgi:type IX secretion system PorP/SprF family membrane protein